MLEMRPQRPGVVRRLLTVDEAVQIPGMSRSTLYTRIMRGDIPSLKIGGLRRLSVAALDRFIERSDA